MSYQPLRTEKNCLNCGTTVAGRYCQTCGQENIVTHQNVWSLIRHFVYDIFHFDGKFFDTLRFLLFRPGRLPKEYVAGKRQSYLDPIRMYLFTSAVFFLIFFSMTDGDQLFRADGGDRYMSRSERFEAASGLVGKKDSASLRQIEQLLDSTKALRMTPEGEKPLDTNSFFIRIHEGRFGIAVEPADRLDSISFDDNFMERKVRERFQKSGNSMQEMMRETSREFAHRLPYLLFISLPIFALLLKLLYVRRKQFFYSDHAVFTLYHYIFSFILLLVILFLARAQEASGWIAMNWLTTVVVLLWPVYLWISMRRFYAQGWGRTTGKFLLLNLLGFLVLLLLFVIFVLFSILF